MFQRFKYKLAKFMYGRCGPDNLYRALLLVYFILFVISLFVKHIALYIAMTVVILIAILRMMSRNRIARYKENQLYLKLTGPFRRFFSLSFSRIKDIKTKRYRTCPHCKATMRLPIKKGKHTVRCRKCGKEFKVRIII